ncbi:hypothetical protein GQR58_014009 [Nymphon striatum]|nr:hypothetical protein GQR58_014009 [Nymphon striatum]
MSHKTVDLDGRPLLSSGPVRADDDNDDNDLDNNRKTEYRSAFLRQLRDMLNMKQSTLGHKDMQMTRIINDEADVQALVTMLESNWINPFDENSQELVSISSGKLATPDITEDLLHAHESGKKAYNAFKTERLEQEPPEIENGRVLSHLLGPLPTALASPDGLMRTTYKSSLGHELQNNVVPAANIPQPCCCIINGMALVQKMRGEGTFSELASTLLDVQRLRRGSSTGTSFKNIAPGHKLHQWRKFLANSNNKECLVTFLVKEWQEEKHRKKLNDKSLFVTRGKLCYHVTSSGTQIASDLESTQEEADIRMLLHAAHASRSDYEAIVVVSDDTDVLVLCLAFKPPISTNMYVKCGTKTRVKYADITKVFNALGYELSQALPGTYSVNKLRYRLFCAKKRKLESHQIPPCADLLYKHCLRANYQAKIWKSALHNSPDIPGPGGHGWKLDLSDPGDLCKLQTCTNQTIRTDNTAQEMDDSDSDEEFQKIAVRICPERWAKLVKKQLLAHGL